MIVTDRGITSLHLTDPLQESLEAAGIAFTVFDETCANPTISNVEAAKDAYLAFGGEAFIAFGGGSAMDCAKAAAARVAKPGQSVEKMEGLLKIRRKLPLLIAVPTTAGTGSETTLAAVITDDKTHHKYPINDFALIPRYALLDYHTTLGLPKNLTATTGMDAMTHAVEAYIGRSTTKYTRAMAEEAVTLINTHLPRAYADGSDTTAREKMLRASYCAGNAFTRSYVGYVHGVAHSLGGMYGVPHGLANAVILPHFLDEYASTAWKRLGRLARNTGIADTADSDEIASKKFIARIKELNGMMEIPEHLDGIREKDIPLLASYADKESNPLYPVPKLMDAKELEKMYYIVAGDKLIRSWAAAANTQGEKNGHNKCT